MTVNANEVIEDEDVEEEQPDLVVRDVAQMDAMPTGSIVRYRDDNRYYKDGEMWGALYATGQRNRATINSTSFHTAIQRGHVVIDNDPNERNRILADQREEMEQTLAEVKAERDAAIATVAEKQAEVTEKDQRFDGFIEALHEKAIEKDYCGDFDELMDELGLPARPREYDVTWEVTYRVTTTVRSTDEDEAHNQVDRAAIYEQVRENASYPSAVNHEYTELS